jgi:hypothetical protein
MMTRICIGMHLRLAGYRFVYGHVLLGLPAANRRVDGAADPKR